MKSTDKIKSNYCYNNKIQKINKWLKNKNTECVCTKYTKRIQIKNIIVYTIIILPDLLFVDDCTSTEITLEYFSLIINAFFFFVSPSFEVR